MEARVLTLDPFGKHDGEWKSLDGTPAGPFDYSDLEEVLHHHDSGGGWDGDEVAILKLKDGRFVSYETFWGPTGDGFHQDAYGGGAELCFAKDLKTVVNLGISDANRELLGFPREGL